MQASLSVRPPVRSQAADTLYPPLVAQIHNDQDDSGAQCFATAVLLDKQGIVLDGVLRGATAVTGVPCTSDTNVALFAFTDLAIAVPGTYTIRLDIYRVSPLDANGATLVAQISCDELIVQAGATTPAQPTSAERDVLKLAQDAGVSIPQLL